MSNSTDKSVRESGPWSFGAKSGMRERLGTYLIGITLGLLITGMIVMLRQQAAQREAARQQAQPSENNQQP